VIPNYSWKRQIHKLIQDANKGEQKTIGVVHNWNDKWDPVYWVRDFELPIGTVAKILGKMFRIALMKTTTVIIQGKKTICRLI